MSFKDDPKQLYSVWLFGRQHALTLAGRVEKPSRTLLWWWINMALPVHLTRVIVKGFKKCYISIAIDGTGDVLWNDGEEVGNVNSVCEENKGTECVDGQSANSDVEETDTDC
jgi:hypothetical protein